MEEKLRALFDYQRFESSSRLAKLIEQTESRSVRELTDDEAELVNAAGGIQSDCAYMWKPDEKR